VAQDVESISREHYGACWLQHQCQAQDWWSSGHRVDLISTIVTISVHATFQRTTGEQASSEMIRFHLLEPHLDIGLPYATFLALRATSKVTTPLTPALWYGLLPPINPRLHAGSNWASTAVFHRLHQRQIHKLLRTPAPSQIKR